jgi:hypothetical protein
VTKNSDSLCFTFVGRDATGNGKTGASCGATVAEIVGVCCINVASELKGIFGLREGGGRLLLRG